MSKQTVCSTTTELRAGPTRSPGQLDRARGEADGRRRSWAGSDPACCTRSASRSSSTRCTLNWRPMRKHSAERAKKSSGGGGDGDDDAGAASGAAALAASHASSSEAHRLPLVKAEGAHFEMRRESSSRERPASSARSRSTAARGAPNGSVWRFNPFGASIVSRMASSNAASAPRSPSSRSAR